jgi:hypothetical protein
MSPFRNGQPKEVHAPGYDGPDRRVGGGKRSSDKIAENIRLVAVVLGIAVSIFSAGGGYMAAKMAIEGKVGKEDFANKNAEQDSKIRDALNRIGNAESLIRDQVIPDMRDVKVRLRDIYCDGKPPGCQ